MPISVSVVDFRATGKRRRACNFPWHTLCMKNVAIAVQCGDKHSCDVISTSVVYEILDRLYDTKYCEGDITVITLASLLSQVCHTYMHGRNHNYTHDQH